MGIPPAFSRVLKALHEHTKFRVFVHNGYSSEWLTDRGLREGCPSSRSCSACFIMRSSSHFGQDAVHRLPSLAWSRACMWSFKVDGHVTRTGNARLSSRGVRNLVVGDVEFADDTTLLGEVDELKDAEALFIQTLRDWEQVEHPGKREKLVLVPGGRQRMEVLHQFEKRVLKHLGAIHVDNADQWAETKRRVQAGFFAVRRIAKLWSLDTQRGCGKKGGLATVRRLKIRS